MRGCTSKYSRWCISVALERWPHIHFPNQQAHRGAENSSRMHKKNLMIIILQSMKKQCIRFLMIMIRKLKWYTCFQVTFSWIERRGRSLSSTRSLRLNAETHAPHEMLVVHLDADRRSSSRGPEGEEK